MRESYPSDISREQFENIRPILEAARKFTRPRPLDLYDVFCGVVYVLKSGCQWRMPPKEEEQTREKKKKKKFKDYPIGYVHVDITEIESI